MSERPNIGDKVRVSYYGAVTGLGEREFTIGNGLKFGYEADAGYPQSIEILEHAKPKVIEKTREELLAERDQILLDLSAGYGHVPDLVDRLSEVDFLLGWPPEAKP